MNRTVKIILYIVLSACLLGFGYGFYATSRSETPGRESTDKAEGTEEVARPSSKRIGRMMSFGVLGFLSLVGIAVLAAWDISKFAAHRVERLVFNEDGEGVKDPEYEEAERVWANGKHLEAVQLLRDYLKKDPAQIHAALRIAEIYEKDLGNHLAAALEYEDVLKHKLPAERWGWAAIHLANLYSGKLNKPDQATTLLQRIVEEYGQTAAAKKARQRLGLPEPLPAPAPEAETDPPEAAATPPEPAPSNLPPGFRPKKG